MKGKQLILEQARNLIHDSKIWIETGDTTQPYPSEVYTVDKKLHKFFNEKGYWHDFNSTKFTSGRFTIHTWDEFPREMVEAMACEIAELRCYYHWEIENSEFICGIVDEFRK